jgi:hypothetical protein
VWPSTGANHGMRRSPPQPRPNPAHLRPFGPSPCPAVHNIHRPSLPEVWRPLPFSYSTAAVSGDPAAAACLGWTVAAGLSAWPPWWWQPFPNRCTGPCAPSFEPRPPSHAGPPRSARPGRPDAVWPPAGPSPLPDPPGTGRQAVRPALAPDGAALRLWPKR